MNGSTNLTARSMRDGQVCVVRPIAWPDELVPWWCHSDGGVLYVRQWYHWQDRQVVLCWTRTEYSFTDDWPAGCQCACTEQPQMSCTLREVVACAVCVADIRLSVWTPTVLLLPGQAIARLQEVLTQSAVVTIERRLRRHVVKPCQHAYPVPELTCDPVRMLYDFARGQVGYSLAHYPPVVGRAR